MILHSDQGYQFPSWEFVSYCKEKKGIQSMSKTGCPDDNAPMERFYNTLKYNHIHPHPYNGGQTPFEARTKR
ncbi:MAG: DDE-type integrase/transposase/recombinase [Lachnospiraceae bacterium]|nr:DDE-type integrase/transposase/recombinase [Lachnospiraceae bacterium]